MHPRFSNLVFTTAALIALNAAPAAAGPLGGTVVGGSATIQGQGGPAVIVNQSSNSAIINWNTFNIGVNESLRFNQPSSSSVVLNRVTGGLGPSEIMGTLTANGRVFVINRDGILFGPSAVVNTAGFLATTNDIRNRDFMAGRYNFNIPGRPDASIVNQGRITATSGGFAALVAPGVRNSGTITATLGTVALASGNSFTLDLYGDKLITLAVSDHIASKVVDVATGQPLKSLVSNEGKIRANGGRVELTAAAARVVVDSVINTSGVIKANSIGRQNGMIVLSAATGASKPAGAATQSINISGTLSAAGRKKDTQGGTILVSGEDIKVANARIDASGRRGGGKVLIGGDWGGGNPNTSLVSNPSAKLETYVIPTATTVSVDAATTINASATGRGNGGKVVLWSDSETTFAGTILARGGTKGGDGGFVETSSHGQLAFTGNVDSSAPRGRAGTLLLDPQDFFIVSTCDGPCQSNQTTATIIQNQLANQNVVIATNNSPQLTGNGDILVNASINWASSNSLTLSAYRNINIAGNVTIANTAAGNLLLRADSTGNGVGTVTFASGTPPGQINFSQSTGTVSIYYNPTAQTVGTSKYQNPSPFLCSTSPCGGVFVNQPSQLTAYMLVNNASDLQLVSTAPGGTYALGTNFSASGFTGFAPATVFTGVFDGNGGLGVNYTISDLSLGSANSRVALFPSIGSGATVRNLNLANVNTTGTGSLALVGTVAGQNDGTISNVHVLSGTVSGGSQTGVEAGGLVAHNTGLIQSSSSAANVSIGGSNFIAANDAGGLVGLNVGTITASSASGTASGGAGSAIGGLVGANGLFNNFGSGSITSSSATGNVSSGDINVRVGGLVGFNAPGSTITASSASGNVTSTASVVKNGPNCSLGTFCQNVSAGGLAGENFGTITQSSSGGSITVGTNGTGGGLVGFNAGIIESAFATGNVTGAAGSTGINGQDGSTGLGGLVGNNQGLISDASASGNVGSANVANLQAGGLVGNNAGTILSSSAAGSVQAGSGSVAGGLVASNSASNNFNCSGCGNVDGSPYFNTARIVDSRASGNVSVGAGSLAGGFVGASDGVIAQGSATGAVTGGGNSILGGFIGALGLGSGSGAVSSSTSSGAVTSTGPNSVVGGFVGVNGGVIAASSTSSPVTGTSESYLGGFVGLNLGAISSSTASGSVTGTGTHDVIGGFVGANFGSIDSSSASGNATGGSNSAVGGFAGANARFINFSAGSIPGSSFPVGTITNSTATGTATGGPGSTVDPFIALNDPNSASNLPTFPSTIAGCSDPLCGFINTGILPPPPVPPAPPTPTTPPTPVTPVTPQIVSPLAAFSPEFFASLPGQAQIDANLVGIDPTQLAALNTAPVVNIPQSGGVALPPQPVIQRPGAQAPAAPNLPPGLSNRIIDIPPISETSFVNDEAVVQIATSITLERLRDAVAPLGLTVIASENLGITQSTVVRLRITNGQNVRQIIRALASVQLVAVAQPNYIYRLHQQGESAPASRGDTGPKGDAAQYILEKLKIPDVHRLVRGNNVLIAVIDSEIDAAHPDLEGVIAQNYDAVGAPEKPHSHGTGMAGAIASHQRLLGTAPGARLLAVHAFSTAAASPESTTFNILKGVDWSVRQGARIINMSFAGPKDPSLARALQAAYDKGIVLIAAAGNAGPKSPPLYPGADPNVIAVTATDVDDKLFTGANRGRYISVSAPGVDILVPAPEGDYQITTGTSVAAAEVSGIVALLLERNPKLTPADIRRILTLSAKRLSPGDRDDNFGSGLIDPLQALQLADPRSATTAPPGPRPATRQR